MVAMGAIEVLNPATGERVRTYETLSEAELDAALGRAQLAFRAWRNRSGDERAAPIRAAARILRERAREWAVLMAEEMGKPVSEGCAEAEKCASVCEYYAEHAAAFLADKHVETEAARSFVTYQPLGVVLAVMPWNFPFWQVFRFAAPTLMAGNAAVLKHASNVPGCALAIEEILATAGLPEGVFQTLLIETNQVEPIIRDARIAAVTLTGSTEAGRAVGSAAGRALKKSVLELGGSDPYVIFADANLDAAVEACAQSRMINGGQSCIAAKRFVVVPEIRNAFESGLVARLKQVRMGDPLDPTTTLGPQARVDLRDELHEQVVKSIELGATKLLGGEVPARAGAYYPPTVLTDVRAGMPAYAEELFGPVAAIIPVANEEEALRVANDSSFGLGASVFTRDVERGEAIARTELEVGCSFVNTFVRSDPRLPFGGIKTSGYGRELGEHGILEFVNIKTVYVD